jgi:hypothetical protein
MIKEKITKEKITKEKITKEYIIEYLKKYYETYKIIPRSSGKHPFCRRTILKNFGFWNNLLIEAKIPLFKTKALEVNCKKCNTLFKKNVNQIKKTNYNFCSRSCSVIFHNTHKTSGYRISKLEVFLQENLKGYNFNYNNRTICDGLELDIYIDELKIAFEINGIIHYKPIYGEDKYNNIIQKDLLKNKLAKNKDIIIYTIKDESKKFSIKYGKEILEKIYKIIHKTKYKHVCADINIIK